MRGEQRRQLKENTKKKKRKKKEKETSTVAQMIDISMGWPGHPLVPPDQKLIHC